MRNNFSLLKLVYGFDNKTVVNQRHTGARTFKFRKKVKLIALPKVAANCWKNKCILYLKTYYTV